MKMAAFALVCVMGAAASVQAAEPARAPDMPPFPPVAPPPANSDPKAVVVPAQDQAAKARAATPQRVEPPHGRVCFNSAETREKIVAHHLADPFRALRAGRLQGEALRAKLCRWKQDDFVYEIAVLRRDGRLVRVYMNAQNGQTVGSLNDPDKK
jgi:hypothetical protein